MWWGYSQALDFLDENVVSSNSFSDEDSTHNILLIGQSDCRHVVKTIAQKYRHSVDVKVNFYIYEPLLENIARELLFLTLSLEPTHNLGLFEKTYFFMELYGNSLLRPTTANYLIKVSKRLLNVITNSDYAKKILPSFCFEKLKYKEKDQLEVIFKYWASKDNSFNILDAWDERLRKHLGPRYDSRSGAFDWDYHMRYRCEGADVLNLREYKRFREKGLAFYFDDTNPCISNRTLASAVFSTGSKILSYGYLGDIITGPYPTFGFNCEDKDMFQKVNGHMRKNATQITERNILRIFHEIEHQTPFLPITLNEDEGLVAVYKDDSTSVKAQNFVSNEESEIKTKDSLTLYESLSTNNCKITFLSTAALQSFASKAEYENFFDSGFIAQIMVMKQIKPDIFKVFKPNSKVIIDTPKFLLNYRMEDLERFSNDLENLMSQCNCELLEPYDYKKDEFVKYRVK